MPIPPKGLQSALIFYFTCIIFVTSGFSGILTLSRENLALYQEAIQKSVFLGRMSVRPAFQFLAEGSPERLREVWENRLGGWQKIRVTIYDSAWGVRWGDPARLPAEGFPTLSDPREVAVRSGLPGQSSREVFFPVASGGVVVGAVGVGVPEFLPLFLGESVVPMLFSMAFNILMGVGLAIFVAQIILRPVSNLVEGLEAVKRGDFNQRLTILGTGELAEVTEVFNLMTSSLQEKTREAHERTRVLDEKVQELWEIYGLTKEMGFSLHLQQILERFLEKAQTLSYSSYGQILLFNPTSRRLEAHVETPVFPNISRRDYDILLQRCLDAAETIEGHTIHHTLLLLPLVSGRLVQGILFLGKMGQQKYSEGIRRFLETIAPLGGSLIENAQLYQHVVEMKDYVRHVLESVDSGVATLDEGGRLVTTNTTFRRLLGLDGEPLDGVPLGEALRRVTDPAFAERLERRLQPRPATAEPGESVVTLQRPGEEARILQIRVHPLRAGESTIGRVLVLDDLTGLKQIERRMLESEKWAVLGRLAASVAHEIRNPLAAIRGLAEFLGEDLGGEQREHIRVVIGEVDRLNKVVEQLLNLARPETTNLRRISLVDILEELFLLVRHEAHRHQVSLKREWLLHPVYVSIDAEKMKQAFLNVMLNAIQAMEGGGNLTVKVLSPEMAGVPPLPDFPRTVIVEFRDEGPGIPPDVLDRVFEPFFTTRPHGTGLGLAIARKVLDLHQGRITIESPPGEGTRVVLAIPCEEPPPAGAA
ncbi:MAG: PAS domain-containing protein [Candidatus Riflebacteria bacterium]|nr:PAS domain-containing protein [Candidatus Riflebacteria bacterium]